MLLLGFDLETTGLDIDMDRVIEIGMALWDTETKMPLKIFSEFINEIDRPELKENHITHITEKIIKENGHIPNDRVISLILKFFDKADYIVAHNGNDFDKPMFTEFLKRYGYEMPDKIWLDTLTDVKYPDEVHHKNMLYLSAYHNFINPFPHRAIFDVMAMFKIMENYDLNEIIDTAQSPTVTIEALVSYDDRHLAKDCHFTWGESKGKKRWCKFMKKKHVDEFVSKLPFQVKIID